MLQDQYEKLVKTAEEIGYLSIGVNADGEPVRGGIIPWERTVSAFNMRPPQLTVSAADLSDGTVKGLLEKCRVVGCYVFEELDDYSFIEGLGDIRDLFILRGGKIKDLSFVRRLKDLFMLYLEDASLPDLRPLVDVCNEGTFGPGKCFGFRNCRVADTSALTDIRFTLSELLIWPAEGDSAERWKTAVRPGVFRFYAR